MTNSDPHSLIVLPQGEAAITSPFTQWRDFLGIAASIACAIHCAVMPLVLGMLPTLGLSFLADHSFHRWMAFACFAIAIAAFLPGFRKHGKWLPAALGGLGLCVLFSTAFLAADCCSSPASPESAAISLNADAPSSEIQACTESCCNPLVPEAEQSSELSVLQAGLALPWLTPLGGLFLVVGHLLNHRFACRCDCCSTETA